MKSLASSLTPVQYRVWNTTLSLRHSSIKSPMVSERKGEYPHSSVYVITPRDQRSTGFPCPLRSITSGAA